MKGRPRMLGIDNNLSDSDFRSWLKTLPIEEKLEVLRFVRQRAIDLGIASNEETLISRNFLNFFPGVHPESSLN